MHGPRDHNLSRQLRAFAPHSLKNLKGMIAAGLFRASVLYQVSGRKHLHMPLDGLRSGIRHALRRLIRSKHFAYLFYSLQRTKVSNITLIPMLGISVERPLGKFTH